MKLASIDLSIRVAEGSRRSCLQNLSNQLNDRSLNRKGYLLSNQEKIEKNTHKSKS